MVATQKEPRERLVMRRVNVNATWDGPEQSVISIETFAFLMTSRHITTIYILITIFVNSI